jgi:drug/metabolite transporter (DMT)-like permease
MVILLGLTAAVLYGSGDFLGGMATRRAPVLAVLTVANTAAVIAAAVLRRGLLPHGTGGLPLPAAAAAGVIDVVANICYVAATRTGMFGLAVVLASLYPGVTVLMARMVLGERLRWIQRAGLVLAAIGILLVAA